MSKLVRSRDNNQTSIQFQCGGCGRQFITAFGDIGKSYTCPTCGGRVNTLSVFCHYEGCGGRYEQCGGTIKKLSGEELAAEERKAFESEDVFAGATPTDSYHDDIGDIRASIITYRCDKCGDSYNASYGYRQGLDSGQVKCERITCSSCGRLPETQELPEPDGYPNACPDKLWREPRF